MDLVIVGDCIKHDYVLAAAVLIKIYSKKRVAIITDEDRSYRYFDGEVSGVEIITEGEDCDAEIKIYDCHYSLPNVEDPVIYLATNYEKPSLESVEAVLSQLVDVKPSGLIVIENDSSVTLKYVLNYLQLDIPVISYLEDSYRKTDWVYDGRISYKVSKDFVEAVITLLESTLGIPNKEAKRLWSYARKRG